MYRLINTGNIEQNTIFVKMQFLRFCNFFHKKFIKSKLVNFSKMAKSKVAFTKRVKSIPTYDHFKNSGMSKAGIYKILTRFDESGNVDCKPFEGQNYEG